MARRIYEEPKTYNQGEWVQLRGRRGPLKFGAPLKEACGTMCCVAGWVTCLTRKPGEKVQDIATFTINPQIRAQRVLGLSSWLADDLFDGGALRLLGAKSRPGTRAYANAGVRHINIFLMEHFNFTGDLLKQFKAEDRAAKRKAAK